MAKIYFLYDERYRSHSWLKQNIDVVSILFLSLLLCSELWYKSPLEDTLIETVVAVLGSFTNYEKYWEPRGGDWSDCAGHKVWSVPVVPRTTAASWKCSQTETHPELFVWSRQDRRHLFNIRKSRTWKSRLLTSKEHKRSYRILIIPDQFSVL